jgi:hypothetical protein
MQILDYNAFFFLGFTFVVPLIYFVIKRTSVQKERFFECYTILALGLITEQISALYWGIYFGNILIFYLATSLIFAPAVILMSADLIRQYLVRNRDLPKQHKTTIEIE